MQLGLLKIEEKRGGEGQLKPGAATYSPISITAIESKLSKNTE